MDSITALDFANIHGLSPIDKYALNKKYQSITKSTPEWFDLLREDFTLDMEPRVFDAISPIKITTNQENNDKK